MKVAIMQPYFMPYLGYFQLITAVDRFVIYDDVNYIKRGYINRNAILIDGHAHSFTLPLRKASQNKLIHEIELLDDDGWKGKLLNKIVHAYAKAPFFNDAYPVIEDAIRYPEANLSVYLVNSIRALCAYLGIETEIVDSSRIFGNRGMARSERIIDIVRQCGGDSYINPAGGVDLYDKAEFESEGISLGFIRMNDIRYKQFDAPFVGNLSIIDLIMFNSREAIGRFINDYRVV
jgi:hypothetical protein